MKTILELNVDDIADAVGRYAESEGWEVVGGVHFTVGRPQTSGESATITASVEVTTSGNDDRDAGTGEHEDGEDAGPMLYSAEALEVIRAAQRRLGELLKLHAVCVTRAGDRSVVTGEDAWLAFEAIDMEDVREDNPPVKPT